MIQYLDEDLAPVVRLGFADFHAVLANQLATGAMAKLKASSAPFGEWKAC
jgi:hypothetical protein